MGLEGIKSKRVLLVLRLIDVYKILESCLFAWVNKAKKVRIKGTVDL